MDIETPIKCLGPVDVEALRHTVLSQEREVNGNRPDGINRWT